MSNTILSHLAAVQFASPNNFYGRDAKTYKGSLVWAARQFKAMEAAGLVRKIPTVEYGPDTRANRFYYLTPKGARLVDQENYKYREPRTRNNAEHESAKIDISLSFVLGYPNLIPEFDYNRTLPTKTGKPYCPDIVVTLKTLDYQKSYQFIVEIERYREPSRIKAEKLDLIETLKPWKEYGLSFNTQVLIVYTHRCFKTFWRPQQYDPQEEDAPAGITERIGTVTDSFRHLLNLTEKLPAAKYRFLPFHEFPHLHESVWYTPRKERVKLINN